MEEKLTDIPNNTTIEPDKIKIVYRKNGKTYQIDVTKYPNTLQYSVYEILSGTLCFRTSGALTDLNILIDEIEKLISKQL